GRHQRRREPARQCRDSVPLWSHTLQGWPDKERRARWSGCQQEG
ncbi:hypothetical protein BN1723_020766, partial [Verticillium longisporum]